MFLVLLLFLGVLFRLWLTSLVPQGDEFDQKEYHYMALEILGEKQYMYLSSYRMSGYPLILAGIYTLFGNSGKEGVILVQSILDVVTGVLLFAIGKIIFRSSYASWLGLILYLVNPITSAYVGVRLTELLATFLVVLAIFCLVQFAKTARMYFPMSFAAVVGFIPQVRPNLLPLTVFSIVFLLFWLWKNKRHDITVKSISTLLVLFCYSLMFIYSSIRNYTYFGKFSLLTVDNMMVRELYGSLLMDSYDTMPTMSAELNNLYIEFTNSQDDEEDRKIAAKYTQKTKEKVLSDIAGFLVSRVKKMWYVWQKYNLFPYENPKIPLFREGVFWGNLIVLAFGGFSFYQWVKEKPTKNETVKKVMIFAMISLFFSITIIHTLVMTAGRFSIPFYPFVFLFVGYGLLRVLHFISWRNIRKGRWHSRGQ